MAFDPDAYLNEGGTATAEFDPDAYLGIKPEKNWRQSAQEYVGQAMQLPAKALMFANSLDYQPHWPTQQEYDTANKPLFQPPKFESLPESGVGGAVRGVAEGVGSAASGITTPENTSLLAATAGAGNLGLKLISGVFLGQSLLGTPEQWQALKDAPTTAEKFKIGTEMGLGLALPALGLKAGELGLGAKKGLNAEARSGVDTARQTRQAGPEPIGAQSETRTQPPPPAVSENVPETQTAPLSPGNAPESFRAQTSPQPETAPKTSESPVTGKVLTAIRLKDGQIISAPSHSIGYDIANEKGLSLAGSEEGFVTPEGKFLYRDEAFKELGGSTAEDLRPKKPQQPFNKSDADLLAALSESPDAKYQGPSGGAAPEAQTASEAGRGVNEPTAKAADVPLEKETSTEASPQGQNPTSTKNAVTAAEREARGIAPAEESARRDFGTVWDEAEATAAKDPTAPQRLVEELKANPRPLTDHENALLLRRQIEVQNEHDAAIKAVNNEPGNESATSRLEAARNALQDTYDAAKASGVEQGRGLNSRKLLANRDFSLAKMESEFRAVANDGKPLSAKQAAEVKALHDKIANLEGKLSAYETRGTMRDALKAARASKKPFSPVQFLSEQEAAARARIVARRGKLYADPLGVTNVAHLADEAIIGAAHIARGVRNLGEWSAAMIKDFGEGIKPYLKALFVQSQQMHSDAARLASAKSRTVTQTINTLRRIGANELERPKTAPVKPDVELLQLRANLQRAKDEYFKRVVQSKLAKQSLPRKMARYGAEVLNTSKAVKSSFDLSAVLRQGAFVTLGHPIMALKGFPDMLRAFRSEAHSGRIMEGIKNRENFPRYQQAELFIADDSGMTLSKMEEQYMSRWAKNIPIVAGSERAYVTFLNKLRADAFDSIAASLDKKGAASLSEDRAIANYVNVATGRGDMAAVAQAATGLSTILWSPRLMVSRFQLLAGQPFYRGSTRTRIAIAKEYAKFLGGIATVYALGKAAGATVETDPRSSDFGKLKFNNTRVDPMGGLAQATVLTSRLGSGETKTNAGKIVAIRGDKVPFGTGNSADVVFRFLRSKLTPALGSALNVASGKNVVGQPASLGTEATQMFIPLSFGDIYQAMQEQGVERGTALSMLAILGMGVNTYAPSSKSERKQTLSEAMEERQLKARQ